MLNYRTLENKPQRKKLDENNRYVYYLDLLSKTWDRWEGYEYINPIVVNEYYVARPDLISLACYGTDEYGDMICKFNGISNPFELNEGMLIFIPPMEWISEGTKNRETTACDTINSTDNIIQSKSDIKKYRDDARSSSSPTVGDSDPYIIDKTLGLVFY